MVGANTDGIRIVPPHMAYFEIEKVATKFCDYLFVYYIGRYF